MATIDCLFFCFCIYPVGTFYPHLASLGAEKQDFSNDSNLFYDKMNGPQNYRQTLISPCFDLDGRVFRSTL